MSGRFIRKIEKYCRRMREWKRKRDRETEREREKERKRERDRGWQTSKRILSSLFPSPQLNRTIQSRTFARRGLDTHSFEYTSLNYRWTTKPEGPPKNLSQVSEPNPLKMLLRLIISSTFCVFSVFCAGGTEDLVGMVGCYFSSYLSKISSKILSKDFKDLTKGSL